MSQTFISISLPEQSNLDQIAKSRDETKVQESQIETLIVIDIKDNSSDDLKTAGISDMYQQIHENQIQQLKKLGKKPHEIAMELKAYSLREFNDLIEKTLRSRGFHKQKRPSTITLDIDLNEISSMALGYADIIDNLEQGLPNRYRKKFKPKQEFNQSALQIENILKGLMEYQENNPRFAEVLYITNNERRWQINFEQLRINVLCLPPLKNTTYQYNLCKPNGGAVSLYNPLDAEPLLKQIKLPSMHDRIRVELKDPCKFQVSNSKVIYLNSYPDSQELKLEIFNATPKIEFKLLKVCENYRVIDQEQTIDNDSDEVYSIVALTDISKYTVETSK